MNIDERLEKLTERHEALTQTVEIIAAMQKDNERLSAERSAAADPTSCGTDQRIEV
ncbi:MAG: hypothetical protein ABSG41_19590 [Bryobacteraceae bacterium]